jgi:hypothetical protein
LDSTISDFGFRQIRGWMRLQADPSPAAPESRAWGANNHSQRDTSNISSTNGAAGWIERSLSIRALPAEEINVPRLRERFGLFDCNLERLAHDCSSL